MYSQLRSTFTSAQSFDVAHAFGTLRQSRATVIVAILQNTEGVGVGGIINAQPPPSPPGTPAASSNGKSNGDLAGDSPEGNSKGDGKGPGSGKSKGDGGEETEIDFIAMAREYGLLGSEFLWVWTEQDRACDTPELGTRCPAPFFRRETGVNMLGIRVNTPYHLTSWQSFRDAWATEGSRVCATSEHFSLTEPFPLRPMASEFVSAEESFSLAPTVSLGYVYDATVAAFLALSQSGDPSEAQSVYTQLASLDFAGATGRVQLMEGQRASENMLVEVNTFDQDVEGFVNIGHGTLGGDISFVSKIPWAAGAPPLGRPTCEAGTHWVEQVLACIDCSPGYFRSTVGNSSLKCEQCNAGTFAQVGGMTACMLCPAGKRQATVGQSECRSCEVGTYSVAGWTDECRPCGQSESEAPTRAIAGSEALVCDNGVLSGMRTGYWAAQILHPSNAYRTPIYECASNRCIGNLTSACEEGYAGPLCGGCATGYFRSGSRCHSCGSVSISVGTRSNYSGYQQSTRGRAGAWLVAVLISVVVGVLVVAIIMCTAKEPQTSEVSTSSRAQSLLLRIRAFFSRISLRLSLTNCKQRSPSGRAHASAQPTDGFGCTPPPSPPTYTTPPRWKCEHAQSQDPPRGTLDAKKPLRPDAAYLAPHDVLMKVLDHAQGQNSPRGALDAKEPFHPDATYLAPHDVLMKVLRSAISGDQTPSGPDMVERQQHMDSQGYGSGTATRAATVSSRAKTTSRTGLSACRTAAAVEAAVRRPATSGVV